MMDQDRYRFYAGRDDDVIKSPGYRIGPMEVGTAPTEHAAVLECASLASPDGGRGEVVKAFIILKPGFCGDEMLGKEVQDITRALTASDTYPRRIELVSELPKTSTREIQRRSPKDRECAAAKG